MTIPSKFFRKLAPLLFFITAALPLARAQESYERYASILNHPPRRSAAEEALTHFLVTPFELVRWPVDKSLILIEKYHVPKKLQWIYDTITDYGVTPHLDVISLGNTGGGVDLDFIRIFRKKERYPDVLAKSWLNWTHDVIFEVGSEVGLERIHDTGFNARGLFKYEKRPEEHFNGIGPHTSAGDGTSYKIEATTLKATLGYSWSPLMNADASFGYRNINITNGEDGGRGQIDRTFFPRVIPGLAGDELLDYAIQFNHDTRNHKEDSTQGGQERLGFSFHDGLGNSRAQYFKYEAELSRFFPLGSERRVLALHLYGEHNNETRHHDVPFHQMAKLGGTGAYPRLSEPLRSYDFNRFFDESLLLGNLEYRYTIWEYRDFKTDAVFFLDEGQVFKDIGSFQFKDFRESYGFGFRTSLANVMFFSIEMAHGDEGTRIYAQTRTPF